jgi:hypothetical protein
MHTTLIFKEQAKVNVTELRERGLVQPIYSIQNIEGYNMLCSIDSQQDLHSSIIKTENKEYCPFIINVYFIWDRNEWKTLSGIS